jgi:cytochrome c55X
MQFVILHGRRGTPMPPWSTFVSEAEARWIVEQLRQGLPE